MEDTKEKSTLSGSTDAECYVTVAGLFSVLAVGIEFSWGAASALAAALFALKAYHTGKKS